ncbi:MAG TPA: ABC transporter ATP-binding protein [Candidatus Acidoferrales bacterium]|nr:ABC transporter ATP-binding protein [Candidatus Acidoferrales bacterium]
MRFPFNQLVLVIKHAERLTMSAYGLEVRNLVKQYNVRGRPPVRAVDGISFAVRRGSIFGLLGPNGAGKTSLLKTLTTLLAPSGGRAEVEGFDVAAQPLEVRRRIALVLQETAVELFLSVRDNLLTYARFRGLGGGRARQRVEEVMERFHLTEHAHRKAQDLSGGTRRRVQVAKVFLTNTPVVFLDEFSTGMDPRLKRAVMDLLRAEAAGGRTIVLTTQVLGEAEELCDDILIMNRGRQVARGDLHSLKLLSAGVYEVALTFEVLPDAIEEAVGALEPLRARLSQNTVEFAIKAEEARVLGIVTELAKLGRALHVEVSGASLEDVFLQLTGEPGAEAAGEEAE